MATKTKYDPFDYVNTQELKYSKHFEEKELRKVYSNFRSIARRRIERLEQYGYTKGAQYQRMKAIGLPVLKEIKNRNQLAMYLQQTAFFISTESSTVKGIKRIRKQKVDQFTAEGFEGLTSENIDDFLQFFDEAKTRSGKSYDMAQLAKVWNASRREKKNPKEIMEDYNKYKEIADKPQARIEKPAQTMNSKQMQNRLQRG